MFDVRPELMVALTMSGRTRARIAEFDSGEQAIRESIDVCKQVLATSPGNTSHLRHLSLSHVWLADLVGGADRYSLGRVQDAIGEYKEGARIAEQMANMDAKNEVAKLDQARALGKWGSVVIETDPAESLRLMDRANELIQATSMGNRGGLEMRLAYHTNSAIPLVRLGRLAEARQRTQLARQTDAEMRQRNPQEQGGLGPILRVESMWHARSGNMLEAVAFVRQELQVLRSSIKIDALAKSYEVVDALQRLVDYGRGIDPAACREGVGELERIWTQMAVTHQSSKYVADRLAAARRAAADSRHCEAAASGTGTR